MVASDLQFNVDTHVIIQNEADAVSTSARQHVSTSARQHVSINTTSDTTLGGDGRPYYILFDMYSGPGGDQYDWPIVHRHDGGVCKRGRHVQSSYERQPSRANITITPQTPEKRVSAEVERVWGVVLRGVLMRVECV